MDLTQENPLTMMEILTKLVTMVFMLVFAFAMGFGLWKIFEVQLRKWRESAFDYVYIEDNGNARELSADEEEYVTTAIFPDHDADRYIKSQYESFTSDGRFSGYLRRRQLPPEIPIGRSPGNS